MTGRSWPAVGVVLPTHDRPELMRKSLRAIVGQDYPGVVETVVVFDRSEPDREIVRDDDRRPVRVMANARTPGLSGARNTGILDLGTDYVAFCDDDDIWLPGKLEEQITTLEGHPDAEFASCGIVVQFGDHDSVRLAGAGEVTYRDLLRSRMSMLHSSTFLARRNSLVDGIGLLDEDIPGSQNEDYDLLLRVAKRHPIMVADVPLVRVLWADSYFSRRWETKVASLQWMLARHPDLTTDPVGSARIFGQLAFAYACLDDRRMARRWAGRSLQANWREPRAVFALAVSAHLVSGETILRALHRHGRGV